MRIDLDGFYLLLTDVPNRIAIHAASQKGVRVIHIPLRWTGSLHWNGRILDRSGVIVWGDACDYSRVGEDVRIIALLIDESLLRERIETWLPSSHSLWDSLDGHMLADTPASRHFGQVAEWVVGLALQGSESLAVPAVRAQLSERLLLALANDKYHRLSACHLGSIAEPLGLFQRGEGVGVTMENEDGRLVGMGVIDRREVPREGRPPRHVAAFYSKRIAETLRRPSIAEILGGGAKVEEIRHREKDRGRLDLAAFPVDRVRGVG